MSSHLSTAHATEAVERTFNKPPQPGSDEICVRCVRETIRSAVGVATSRWRRAHVHKEEVAMNSFSPTFILRHALDSFVMF